MSTVVVDTDTLAEALFVSDLQQSEHPSTEAVQAAVDALVEQIGAEGCAAAVAAEFGDNPDCACRRMAWARQAVTEAFPL